MLTRRGFFGALVAVAAACKLAPEPVKAPAPPTAHERSLIEALDRLYEQVEFEPTPFPGRGTFRQRMVPYQPPIEGRLYPDDARLAFARAEAHAAYNSLERWRRELEGLSYA